MLNAREIMEILPHRYPFLFIDRVLEIESNRIVALKNVTCNEPHFQGHFPGSPVMPGVLLVEAMAQAGGVLMLRDVPDRHEKLIYFTGIDRCRFRRPVVPGDQVIFEVTVKKRRSRFAVLEGVAKVDGEMVAEAQLSSAMVDKQ